MKRCVAPLLGLVITTSLFAQGSLTPPGAPAPLFKTLDQVKPGTPIDSVPFTITNSGHFYLTRSLATTGDGIIVATNDVSVDLGGFTLSGDDVGSDYGIHVGTSTNGHQQHVVLRNGVIRNFSQGIRVEPFVSGVTIEEIAVYKCNLGIALLAVGPATANGCFIRHCTAASNTLHGISIGNPGTGSGQNIISDCNALFNTQDGLVVFSTNNLIIRNFATGNGTVDYSIVANNRVGAIVTPTASGSGTTDPFANLRY